MTFILRVWSGGSVDMLVFDSLFFLEFCDVFMFVFLGVYVLFRGGR